MFALRPYSWLCLAGLMVVVNIASGQNYPSRSIRMLAPVPGGIADIAGRLLAQALAEPLGQQVIIENRPGVVAIETAVKAASDGYTLLVFGPSMWISPLMRSTTSYDAIGDFAVVTLAASAPNILVIHPSLPANSVKDLIALVKVRPEDFNYASGPTGGTPHLTAELFLAMAGIRIMRIPYKGSAQALTDLMAGTVHLMFPPAPSAMAHVASGRLRALAVTSAQTSALAPNLPTVAASLPGYESVSIVGIFAPAGTPESIVNRLNQEIVRVLNAADIKDKLLKSGADAIGGSPQQLTATLKSEVARMGKVIRDRGIREE